MDDVRRDLPEEGGARKGPAETELVGTLTRLSDGREFVLGFGSLRIGRQRRADLVISERTVSRHHADICYEGGRYVLYDHSTNGTWVNGDLVVVARPLRDRDAVRFGKADFVFSLKRVPKREAAARTQLAVSGRIPSLPTRIMRGRRRRRERRTLLGRVLLLLVVAALLAAAAVYAFFPELVRGLVP